MLNQDFNEFLQSLNNNCVRYLVIGGYAVAFHGHPRYTKESDARDGSYRAGHWQGDREIESSCRCHVALNCRMRQPNLLEVRRALPEILQ